MTAREAIAYAITHAPRGQKGGPYESWGREAGESCRALAAAYRTEHQDMAEEIAADARNAGAKHARVIRIVRARPSEASAVEVLRELVAYPGNGGDLARIQARARCVLAASGPDPSEVVRAALSWSEATAANGTARTVALQLACVAYRKAGGK